MALYFTNNKKKYIASIIIYLCYSYTSFNPWLWNIFLGTRQFGKYFIKLYSEMIISIRASQLFSNRRLPLNVSIILISSGRGCSLLTEFWKTKNKTHKFLINSGTRSRILYRYIFSSVTLSRISSIARHHRVSQDYNNSFIGLLNGRCSRR